MRYESGRARALHSELLMADAMHTQQRRADVVRGAGLAASRCGSGIRSWIRSARFVVAVFIARTGLEIARETSPILADRVVLDEEGIRRVVMSVPGRGRLPSDPDRAARSITRSSICTSGSAAAPRSYEAHRLSHVVKDRLMQAYPQIADAIIHIEPPPSEIQSTVGGR